MLKLFWSFLDGYGITKVKETAHARFKTLYAPPRQTSRVELTQLWQQLPPASQQRALQKLGQVLAQNLKTIADEKKERGNE